ncbi:CopY/TcrY family copper transport repressor [Ligilactobacillus pobuzihii]|uniref:Transcriptional regulator n=1 Tax=Ligilactobacillus pobuzihii TaxID=449659 RepID=A0A0R2LDV5_9LACO|nr:CopY/TcrY family copper transport repressor [Ligilactobacillus pobuzihii]KRK09033.1 transcriptional regulator [Ligilactobacillus pobuzihii E100301 = KCTC 13174]KRN99987.1 transcriptional regulator [Ligilactobacillus pobuzihii]GEN48735.1 uracil phosphoribosyltransferase [Ligilactobacillus pobuzihii]
MTAVVDATEMTTSEWELMRIIWTKGKASSSEVIDLIKAKKDWTESTVKTLLRRLVSKSALTTVKDGRRFIYSPNITESDAMDQMTAEMFSRMCNMKKGSEITKLIRDTNLSQADIKQMQAVLANKLRTAPKVVECNCLPGKDSCC